MLRIVHVEGGKWLEPARLLFREYAAWLDIDLCFQNFDEELSNLPATYIPPDGALLLALYKEQAAGCVAVRRLEPDVCEMKRLYVRPQYQNMKMGRQLAEAIVEEAKKLGYKRMQLDTLASMVKAQSLYTSLGFKKIAPYRFSPDEGTVFMELDLAYMYNALPSL